MIPRPSAKRGHAHSTRHHWRSTVGSLGSVEESRLRELVHLSGRYRDVVLTGMLADEFARRRPVTA
ncbi:hypothetical protein ACFXJO_01940 [Streptomyces lavendulae]|uniref:hypothetical protein n=1 Tax=Streptomyces lavendulae TaxID=1914 RepID=UPI0036B3AB04